MICILCLDTVQLEKDNCDEIIKYKNSGQQELTGMRVPAGPYISGLELSRNWVGEIVGMSAILSDFRILINI